MQNVEIVLDLSAFKGAGELRNIRVPELFSKACTVLKSEINSEGITQSYMLYLNGKFAGDSSTDNLRKGDRIMILPLVGGG